ncbi:monocarboxylate transporter 3-like [Pecten maximus]|uniref:monocarboxylate transporter 3-like n=1 Tax=Pecten maximus TaxID=6579 RepID=UPI0014581BB1|nr:monocarboxylate transporter 3-like [Pecten maximus]
MRERPLTEADKGWSWVVMASSFGSHVITGGFQYSIGIVHNAFLERFGDNVQNTSWATSLFVATLSLTGVLASALINWSSCRATMVIGSLIMTGGFITCAFVPSLELAVIFYGVVSGIGAGLIFLPASVVLGFNFRRRRNLASGVAVSGNGVGTFLVALIIEAAREEYGNRGLFFIIAGISLQGAFLGCLLFPSELEIRQKQIRYQNTSYTNKSDILNNILQSFVILKNISFLCLCVSMFISYTGIYLVYVHFVRYAIEMGASSLNSSFLVSVTGVCDCISRFLTGLTANVEDIDENVMFFGTFGLLGISTLIFPLYGSTYGGQLTYAVFLGLYSGCCYSILNTLIIQRVGVEKLATGYGTCMFFSGAGALVGPPAAGAIIDYTGSYENSFLLAGSCITVASILGVVSAYFRKSDNSYTTDLSEVPTVSRAASMDRQLSCASK